MNNTTNNRKIIWTSINPGLPCIKAMLKKEMPDIEEDDINSVIYGVNYRYFDDLVSHLSTVSIGQPIIAVALFEGYDDTDDDGFGIQTIDSGNLGECFDTDYDLAEWYVDKSGDFLSYHIDRDGVTYCKYLAIKKDAPLSKVQRLFTEIDDEDFDFNILGDVTESIGSKVLEALGNMRFCNKGGAFCGK